MKQAKREHIAAIYAAATEPNTLQCISKVLRNVFEADSSGMWLINKGIITDLTGTSDVQESAASYLQYYRTLDVWGGAHPSYVDQVVLGHEKIDDAQLLKTEFYNDFARHYGMRDPMGLVMNLGSGKFASIALNRICGQNFFVEDDKPLFEEMAFHVKNALKLSDCFETKTTRTEESHSAFDSLLFGILVCDKDGAIYYANAAAERMAERGLGFTLGGRIKNVSATLSSEDKFLKAAVWRAAHGRGGGCRLRGKGGAMVSVIATPLIEAERPLGSGKALVAFQRDGATTGVTAQILRELYGFTPAQAEIALLLHSGMTFEEAANARKIAMTTARTHFNAILTKSNARNLRDFLKMLGSLPQIGGSI